MIQFDLKPYGMQTTYLIQRLEPPRINEFAKKVDQTFAFGGGGSGFTKEAFKILSELFTYEYMGNAEFEFDTPRKVMEDITQRSKDFVAETMTLRLEDFDFPWWMKDTKKIKNKAERNLFLEAIDKFPMNYEVYLFVDKKHLEGAKVLISALAKNQVRLKTSSRFTDSYLLDPRFPSRTVGWIEYSNGFFFFKNREMWQNVVEAFGHPRP